MKPTKSVGHVAAAAYQKGMDVAQSWDTDDLQLAIDIADELRYLNYTAQADAIQHEVALRYRDMDA